jgi:hypothetical protein
MPRLEAAALHAAADALDERAEHTLVDLADGERRVDGQRCLPHRATVAMRTFTRAPLGVTIAAWRGIGVALRACLDGRY